MKLRTTFGTIFILVSLIIVIGVLFYDSRQRQTPIIFAEKPMLDGIWAHYKTNYLEPNTYRTLDKQRNNITTSEGQSYTMLRAVWSDDRDIFDKSWKWTKDNLSRSEDKLFAWKFGKRSDGSYGQLIQEGGHNTASDADSDIALALIFAYGRWNNTSYLNYAKDIIADIWNKEVVIINNQPVLVANDVEKSLTKDTAVVNPSYFSPYAYRIFAKIDPSHAWTDLLNNSYTVIDQASAAKLDKSSSANLPPDWILINKNTGIISSVNMPGFATNYGYDAIRTTWRLALDWQWYQDTRDKGLLTKFQFLGQEWQKNKKIFAVYQHDGPAAVSWESISAYGCDIGYFTTVDEQAAKEIFMQKFQVLYNPDQEGWKDNLSYYDENWVWFGIGLYFKQLVNLAVNIP